MKHIELLCAAYTKLCEKEVNWEEVEKNLTEFVTANED